MSLIPNPDIPLEILFEDSCLVAVNKPEDLPVYPLKEDETNTVANALVARFPSQEGIGPPLQAGIVHRLDNTTSGILVAARDNETYKKIRTIWNTEKVIKEYTALVIGRMSKEKKITLPIAHHPSKKKKMMVCETAKKTAEHKARKAETEIRLVKILSSGTGEKFSLVRVRITTGVRHQIRVHLAHAGYPLVGDRLYQNSFKQKQDSSLLPRPFLHLSRVSFPHPHSGKKISLASELPSDLTGFLRECCQRVLM